MDATSLDDSSIAKVSIMKTKKKSLFAWFGRTVAVSLVPLMMVGCATSSDSNDDSNDIDKGVPTFTTDPGEGDTITGNSVIKITFNESVSGVSTTSVVLKDNAGTAQTMTMTSSSNTYSFDPTTDLVNGDYYLVVGEGGKIVDSDGLGATGITIEFRVDDAATTVAAASSAYLASTSLTAAEQSSIQTAVTSAVNALQGTSNNNLLAAIPAALGAGIAAIDVLNNANETTLKQNFLTAMVGAANGAASIDGNPGRTITKLNATIEAGFDSLSDAIIAELVRLTAVGSIAASEMDEMATGYQSGLTRAGADPTQQSSLQGVFTRDLSTAVSNSTLINDADKNTITVAIAGSSTSTGASGTPQNLSTGPDNIQGTANNDVFTAGIISGSMTFDALDTIAGGGGSDTLQILMNGTGIYQAASLTGVETITIIGSGAGTISLLGSTGVTTVSNLGSTANVVASNIGSGAALSATNTSNDSTFTFTNAALEGSTDNVSLSVNNVGGAATITVQPTSGTEGAETISVTTAGNASSITLDDGRGTDTTSINVSGDQDLTLALAAGPAASVTTINASSLTGALTSSTALTAGSNATLTGGSGNDSFIRNATATDSVNLGAGNDTLTFTAGFESTDTLAGGDGTDTLSVAIDEVDTAVLTAALTNVSGFETLTITGNVDAANDDVIAARVNTGITRVNYSGAISVANDLTLEAGSMTVGLALASSAALTVTDTGSATGDALTLLNTATTGAANVFGGQSHNTTGWESLTINTGSTATAAQTLGTLTANVDTGGNLAVAITGANNITTFTSLTTNSSGAVTVNASGLTAQADGTNTLTISNVAFSGTAGTVSITGSEGMDTISSTNVGSTIVGGGGRDSLTGGTSADYLSGGDGNDSLVGAGGNDTILGGDGVDTITLAAAGAVSVDAGAGNDLIDITNTITSTDTISGGDGTDTMIIDSAASSTTAANVSGIETIRIDTAGLAVDLSAYPSTSNTITRVDTNVAGAHTISGASANVATLGIGINSGAATTSFARTTDTSADTLAVSVTGGVTLNQLTASHEETLTVSSSNTGAATITTLVAADLVTLNISGAGNVSIPTATSDILDTINITSSGTVNVGGTASSSLSLSTINASGSSGNITVAGGSSLDVITFTAGTGTANITGGNGADILTAGSAAATLSGGAGIDSITGGVAADSLSGGAGNDIISSGDGADTVTGGTGTDTITLGSGNKIIVIDDAGESATTTTLTSVNGAISVAGADVITGANAGDIIRLASVDNYDAIVTATNTLTDFSSVVSTSALVQNGALALRGVYSSSGGTFSSSSSGTDTLLVFDADDAANAQTYNAIILKGLSNVTVSASLSAANTVDLTIASL